MDRSWVKRNLQTLPEGSSSSVSFSQSESFRKGNLVGYCRITPSEQSSQSDYRSLAIVDKSTHEVVAIQRLESTGEERMSRFGIDTVFDNSCDNDMVRNNIISVEDKNSILCWFWEGFNVSLISYGEVNSGKTFSLFGKQRYDEKCIFEQVSEVLFDLVQANNEGDLGKYLVGLSVFEILYTQDDRCEVVKDLLRISDLKPLSLSSPLELVSVKINSVEEAMFSFNCARNLSQNWKETSEGEFMPINNRAHFFIRFSLYSEHDSRLRHLHIIDLAGSPPANMPQDIRNKLGSEEQLNFTRIGLNQLRSILWELARLNSATNESIDLSTILATRKSKLASVLGPIIASNSRTYLLGVLREDAAFSDSCRTLELIQRAQSITVPCVKGIEIAKTQLEFIQFSVFSR